jgi:aryl-alcohol dehydrogenase-like predicted oxidoreductase
MIGDTELSRVGFGALRILGAGSWGPPESPENSIRVLRRAYELDVNLIDTADSYGPELSERLIADAFHPYPSDLVIATKVGLRATGPDHWVRDLQPDRIAERCDASLRRSSSTRSSCTSYTPWIPSFRTTSWSAP